MKVSRLIFSLSTEGEAHPSPHFEDSLHIIFSRSLIIKDTIVTGEEGINQEHLCRGWTLKVGHDMKE